MHSSDITSLSSEVKISDSIRNFYLLSPSTVFSESRIYFGNCDNIHGQSLESGKYRMTNGE